MQSLVGLEERHVQNGEGTGDVEELSQLAFHDGGRPVLIGLLLVSLLEQHDHRGVGIVVMTREFVQITVHVVESDAGMCRNALLCYLLHLLASHLAPVAPLADHHQGLVSLTLLDLLLERPPHYLLRVEVLLWRHSRPVDHFHALPLSLEKLIESLGLDGPFVLVLVGESVLVGGTVVVFPAGLVVLKKDAEGLLLHSGVFDEQLLVRSE